MHQEAGSKCMDGHFSSTSKLGFEKHNVLLKVPVLPFAYLGPVTVHQLFLSIYPKARTDSCPDV